MTESFIERVWRKVRRMTTKKVVVILGIFEAIDAIVLVITSERIEIESCACAQNEVLGERNGSIYLDDDWNLSERGRNAANTSYNS